MTERTGHKRRGSIGVPRQGDEEVQNRVFGWIVTPKKINDINFTVEVGEGFIKKWDKGFDKRNVLSSGKLHDL